MLKMIKFKAVTILYTIWNITKYLALFINFIYKLGSEIVKLNAYSERFFENWK